MAEATQTGQQGDSAPPPNGSSTEQPAGNGPQPSPGLSDFLGSGGFWLLLPVIVLWLWVMFMGRKQKQKEQKRKQELEGIKKGDRVITIGRMHGTVVSLSEETMTLKPDDKSGATLTFDRIALWKKLPRDGEGQEDKETKAS